MASVIHGFIYNKDIFDELRLDAAEDRGRIPSPSSTRSRPTASTCRSPWAPPTNGRPRPWASRISGPNYWKGEEGRKALIDGKQKFTDRPMSRRSRSSRRWGPYLGDGFKAQNYPDSQNLFTLGRAAIYPAGSWEISPFRKQARRSRWARSRRRCEGRRQVLHQRPHRHRASASTPSPKNAEAAKIFLVVGRLAGIRRDLRQRAAGLLPPVQGAGRAGGPGRARSSSAWRGSAKARSATPTRSCRRGTPNLENELWNVSAKVMNGTLTPEEAAAKKLQERPRQLVRAATEVGCTTGRPPAGRRPPCDVPIMAA